jgi:predicted nucleotidyltransferase
VPGPRRGRGERRLEAALGALARTLNEAGVAWAVIGGLAVIARGVRRMTTDIDVVIRGDAIRLETLVAKLARAKIFARVDDAETFAKENLVLLLRHRPSGVDLDVSLGWTRFEHDAIASSSEVGFGGVRAPMAQADDLVIFKAVAARPKDLEDATSLIVMHRDIDLSKVRKKVRELAALAEEPSLVAGLEAIIRSARPRARQPKKASGSTAKRSAAKPKAARR